VADPNRTITPAEIVAAAEAQKCDVTVNNADHCFFNGGYNNIKYVKN